MNRIDPNDPRITAYALGELDETERAEFEKLLEESDENRSLVAEYRKLAEVLSHELVLEPHAVLTPQQRGVIEKHLANSNGKIATPAIPWTWLFQPYRLAGAFAFCLVVGIGLLLTQSNPFLPNQTEKVAGIKKVEMAKGVPTEGRPEGLLRTPAADQPEGVTEFFARGVAPAANRTLTGTVAGRPLVETGDQLAAATKSLSQDAGTSKILTNSTLEHLGQPPASEQSAAAGIPPLIQAAPMELARADKAMEDGKAAIPEAKPVLQSERFSVVEHPAPPPLVPPSVPQESERKLQETGPVENMTVSSGPHPAPSKPEAAGTAETTNVLQFYDFVIDEDSRKQAESAQQALPWSDKPTVSEEKVASAAPSSSSPIGGPGGGRRSSRLSTARPRREAEAKEENSQVRFFRNENFVTESLSESESAGFDPKATNPDVSGPKGAPLQAFGSHQAGAFGQHPGSSTVGNGNGGMAGGGMGMMGGGEVLQQVASGEERRFGGAAYFYPNLAEGGTVVVTGKPEVITPTESEGVETYSGVVDNPFKAVADEPLSTFSIDVDTAAYSNLRRYLNQGSLPPKEAVRIEEMLNYFPYDYAPPTSEEPFATHVEVAECPWNSPHRLVRIGIKGKVPPGGDRPACNLVFLIDVSGSMQPENKLPLLKKAMTLLLNQLQPSDQVAIVTYASSTGLVLPSTPCSNKPAIQAAIDNLQSGGSTNGEGGIQLAYKTAEQTLLKSGINRVILATDGDFNVGVTSREELEKIITDKAKGGVFLSVLGFGMGNLKDATLETLADKGNGNYAYIDTLQEARKVLVEQMSGTLITIAKDVKIQIEFNPGRAGAYRLIGYENRVMAAQDFNDDRKDAGEIGAGHTVTALYEVVPVGTPINMAGIDPLKYQKPTAQPAMTHVDSPEMMTVKLRYKAPDGDTSKLIEVPVVASLKGGKGLVPNPITGELDAIDEPKPTPDFKFAAAVASFGMLLRESPFRGTATFDTVLSMAQEGKGADKEGYRTEFIQLVGLAKALKP